MDKFEYKTLSELSSFNDYVANIHSRLQMLDELPKIIDKTISPSNISILENYSKIVVNCEKISKRFVAEWNSIASKQNLKSLENFQKNINRINISQINMDMDKFYQLLNNNYFLDIALFHENISEIINLAYSTTSTNITDKSEDGYISYEEFQETLCEQIKNPIGFQERTGNWIEAKKKKYYILFLVVCFIWVFFIEPYLQENIGEPVMVYVVSNVKEIPEKTGKVICKLKENMEAIIVKNTNYYYKVKFVDENGIEQEGYVAKKNLKIIKDEE